VLTLFSTCFFYMFQKKMISDYLPNSFPKFEIIDEQLSEDCQFCVSFFLNKVSRFYSHKYSLFFNVKNTLVSYYVIV
jgi:hypothetical protein